MSKKVISRAQTLKVDHAAPPTPDLSVYCKDLDQWPQSWMGVDRDIPPGEQIASCFRPFLEHLIGLQLSRKTIRKHIDNLWVLGGEIIRDLNQTASLRKKSVVQVLLDAIDDEGGPLLYHCDSEQEQRAFDSTCRKLHRFLVQSHSKTPLLTHKFS